MQQPQIDDLPEDTSIELLGCGQTRELTTLQRIAAGHKVALMDIKLQQPIIKYGTTIGYATIAIKVGEWLHFHNIRSGYDERSSTLDVNTGAPTDTSYQ